MNDGFKQLAAEKFTDTAVERQTHRHCFTQYIGRLTYQGKHRPAKPLYDYYPVYSANGGTTVRVLASNQEACTPHQPLDYWARDGLGEVSSEVISALINETNERLSESDKADLNWMQQQFPNEHTGVVDGWDSGRIGGRFEDIKYRNLGP